MPPLVPLMVAMAMAMTVSHANGMAVAGDRLLIGKTNIFCVKAPCPWRGIMIADTEDAGPSGLLWSKPTLPPLNASPEDADRIVSAWEGGECLAIQGRLTEGRLQVDFVEGDCP